MHNRNFHRPRGRVLTTLLAVVLAGCAASTTTTNATQEANANEALPTAAPALSLAAALEARSTFLVDRRATTLADVKVPALPDAFTQQQNIATYQVELIDIGPTHAVYIVVRGLDSAGTVTMTADLALDESALEALYDAAQAPPQLPFEGTFFKGILFRQAASAAGTPAADVAAGLEASLPASLRAGGALPPATAPGATALVLPGQASAPLVDANDRSVLAPCLTTMLGLLAAAFGCPAIFSGVGTWVGVFACGGGLLAAAASAPSCLCAAGIAPFGSETWNSSLGMGPEFCSCARTTGDSTAWLGRSPRSSGDAACYSCPVESEREQRGVCNDFACYLVPQDRCVSCPVGTSLDPVDGNCKCDDGSEPRGLTSLESTRQAVADCPNAWYVVGAYNYHEMTNCPSGGWGFCSPGGSGGCTKGEEKPGTGGADFAVISIGGDRSWSCEGTGGLDICGADATWCGNYHCGASSYTVSTPHETLARYDEVAEKLDCLASRYPNAEYVVKRTQPARP
ncbi:MAG: hypothetical protein MUF34_25705 [Polyangiaceae bacterium]|nr:hypothetical protein [Polyangiaceae bacterium]